MFETLKNLNIDRMKTIKTENPNSPDNLLGTWLRLNITNFYERGHGPVEDVGDMLLANILDFADDHEKLEQMYDWIISSKGVSFFSNKDLKPFGEEINRSMDRLDSNFYYHQFELERQGVNRDVIDSDDTRRSFIYDFISENSELLKYQLHLR
jgi:hypothetical protein